MNTRHSLRPRRACSCAIAACLVAAGALGSPTAFADDQANVVRQSVCGRDDVVHRIELRNVVGVPGVCDIVHAMTDARTEERTLHQGSADGAFCGARFDDHVASLARNGWSCLASIQATRASSTTRSAGAERDAGAPSAMPRRAEAPLPNPDSSSIDLWRAECQAAMAVERTDAAQICSCAIDVLGEAGFDASDYELLASPYRRGEVQQPVHRAGLLYGVGMMAVDALARCGVP